MADAGLVRRRLKREIEAARQAAAARRGRLDAASQAYDAFLEQIAIPSFRLMANVLRAEGLPFDIDTPANTVRLVSLRNRDDVIALELDPSLDPPQIVLVATRARGQRTIRSERRLKEGASIASLTEDDVIERLIEELRPWLA